MKKNIEVLENDKDLRSEDFYVKFKESLEEAHTFPTEYIFKYVVPSDHNSIAQVSAVFSKANPSVSTRESKTGKYTSITLRVHVNSADEVITYYQEAAKIKGIVSL